MLIRARHVLAAPGELLDPGWLRVRGERIEALGAGAGPGAQPGEEVLDLPEALVMPGLVMAHTHVEYGIFRAHADGQAFVPWIRSLQRRRLACDDEAVLASARLSALELVAAGVTGVGEACTHGVAAVKALREAGVRGVCYLEEFGPDPAERDETMARLRERLDGLVELAAGSRLSIGVSPHAPYTISPPLLVSMLELALERSMPVSTHLAETDAEHDFVTEGTGLFAELLRARGLEVAGRGRSPWADLVASERLGGLSSLLLVHGVRLTPDDLADLGGRPGVHLVHCPRSNARLGCGVAPVRRALDAGVSVLLGTDGACSADRLDPFEEMRAALWLARAEARDPEALSAAEVLQAALRGHRALGFGPGRLEPGAPADLCALSLGHVSMGPFVPGAEAVVLQGASRDVVLTMVAGEVLQRDGRFTRVEADEVLATARERAAALEALA